MSGTPVPPRKAAACGRDGGGPPARLLSLNVGQPRTVTWRGQEMTTSIFKDPVEDRRRLSGHNVDGDRQADRRVHGGPAKAVYAYPFEHYDYWRDLRPGEEIVPGAFGENLTLTGILEHEISPGDRLTIGTAVLEVTQPRMPCSKLALRFDDPEIVAQFIAARRPGFYLTIVREGDCGAGDDIGRRVLRSVLPSIRDIADLRYGVLTDPELARAALAAPHLGREWRETLRKLAG